MPQRQFGAVVHYLRQVAGRPLSGEISDADLLTRFSTKRDEASFELLMWRHGAMVLRLCLDVTHDRHAAEDAFQAVFLALACKAGSIRSRKSLGAWLHQTAYRVALRAQSRALAGGMRVDRNHDLSALPARVEPGDELIQRELRSLLHEEVARLPAKYRCPIILCYFEGLGHEDAARRLGWPKGTVAGRLSRAREMLRKRLLGRGVALPASLVALTATTKVASAMPPGALIQATLRSGLNMAAGDAVCGIDSPQVSALTRGVLQEMFWSNSKVLGALLLCLSLAGGGVGHFAAYGPSERPKSTGKKVSARQPNQVEKLKAAEQFRVQLHDIRCFALSPDGKRFGVGGDNGAAFGSRGKFQIGIGGPSQQLFVGAEVAHIVTCIAFSPDGQTVATGAFDGGIKLWEAATGRERATLRVKGLPVKAITFIGQGTLAISACQDDTYDSDRDTFREVELWNLPTASIRATLPRAESPLAVSADGKRLATGTMGWNVGLWDLENAKLIRTLDGHDFPTKFMGFLPNGKELVTGTSIFHMKARKRTNEVKVWDLDSGKERILAKTGPDALTCGAVSPDGRLVALGSSKHDGRDYRVKVPSVTLLEITTGKVFQTLQGDDEYVSAVAFSADSKTLAFATEGNCVFMCNLSKAPDGK
jgi:RNA polymerase sigma factor (sigma-70 family)